MEKLKKISLGLILMLCICFSNKSYAVVGCNATITAQKQEITVEDEFRKVSDKLVITTDDGSYGEKGFAIDFLKQDEKPDIIMACGPLPMLRAVKQYAIENDIKCEVSLEERMGCGLGACLGCAVKTAQSPKETPEYWHVCKAGPVFEARDVEF